VARNEELGTQRSVRRQRTNRKAPSNPRKVLASARTTLRCVIAAAPLKPPAVPVLRPDEEVSPLRDCSGPIEAKKRCKRLRTKGRPPLRDCSGPIEAGSRSACRVGSLHLSAA